MAKHKVLSSDSLCNSCVHGFCRVAKHAWKEKDKEEAWKGETEKVEFHLVSICGNEKVLKFKDCFCMPDIICYCPLYEKREGGNSCPTTISVEE